MSARYFVVVSVDGEARRHVTDRVLRSEPLATTIDQGPITLLTTAGTPVIALGDQGFVVGTLLTPGRDGALAELSRDTWATIIGSRGRHLIDQYWGGYVAFLASPDSPLDVVRAPFGWLPCFYVTNGPLWACASDMQLLTASSLLDPRLAPAAIARHLLAGDIRHDDTLIAGLSELRGGDRITVGCDPVPEHLWSPWKFTDPARALDDPAEAVHRLRDTARYCVRTRTDPAKPHLLLLSGGLDSSILAACLAADKRDFAALTLVTDNPSGDETPFARRVTEQLGVRLIAERFSVEDVDIRRSAAARLPRPSARSFEQAIVAMIDRALDGATAAIVDGGGGDNVFCSLQSPAPIADSLIAGRGYAASWQTARDLAELTEASVWTTARLGWQRARSGRRFQRSPDISFLTRKVLGEAEAAIDHPWLSSPADTLPGRSVHAGLLVPAQGLVEDRDVFAPCGSAALLVSQPLIELCLRIPSWLWLDRGCNRAAARHAFAGLLPDATLWRRSKGTPDSFLIRLLDANRPSIRKLLGDGLLAELGLLDVQATLAALDDPRPDQGHVFARLMQLVDVEVWARNFAR